MTNKQTDYYNPLAAARTRINKSTAGADASVEAQSYEAAEMIASMILAKKDTNSSK